MKTCQIPHCKRPADGDIVWRGHEVCKHHENIHWKSKKPYIWLKLGLKGDEVGVQTKLK